MTGEEASDATAPHAAFARALTGAWGLAVAITDRHGPQAAFLAAEQDAFFTNRIAYLAARPAQDDLLDIAIDGAPAGRIAADALPGLLRAADLPARRVLALHGLEGHRPADLIALSAALRPAVTWLWLHDHFVQCPGRHLLRRDAVPCFLPPADSDACRICVHGAARQTHLAAMQALLAALRPRIVAPSQAARDLFRSGMPMPESGAMVQPPAAIVLDPPRPDPHALRGTPEDPVRIAFLGPATPLSGWPVFAAALARCHRLPTYRFFQIAPAEGLAAHPGLTGIATDDPAAAIAEARIDLALCLGVWPAPFAWDAAAALAGGAEVIALPGSPAAALAPGRTLLLEEGKSLAVLLTGGQAIARARARAATGREDGALALTGTTASLDTRGRSAPPDWTEDPGLLLLGPDGPVWPARDDTEWHFALPGRAGRLRLASRRLPGRPRRGVALARLAFDGAEVAPGDPRLLAGWRAEDATLWTDGDATLDPGGARRLTLALAFPLRYPLLPLLGPG